MLFCWILDYDFIIKAQPQFHYLHKIQGAINSFNSFIEKILIFILQIIVIILKNSRDYIIISVVVKIAIIINNFINYISNFQMEFFYLKEVFFFFNFLIRFKLIDDLGGLIHLTGLK